jgi:uncharacterized Fe-S cluster-containing radical SAM superfamily protein
MKCPIRGGLPEAIERLPDHDEHDFDRSELIRHLNEDHHPLVVASMLAVFVEMTEKMEKKLAEENKK